MTSRDVVNQVQRIVRPIKVGHAGTLDPLATGVLVVGVGPATRLVSYIQQMRKKYIGTFLLGRHSPTEDVEGKITLLENPPVPSLEQLQLAAQGLVGKIMQQPPAFSALKVNGKRAYNLARKGIAVRLEPRPIIIHKIDIEEYKYPELRLQATCGSGTYIRSLGRDLTKTVGTTAVMSALLRTAVGCFHLEQATQLESIDTSTIEQHLLPPAAALAELPRIVLSDKDVQLLRVGRPLQHNGISKYDGEYAGITPGGQLLAILQPRGSGLLHPVRNFIHAEPIR